jgi:hypothetical protein
VLELLLDLLVETLGQILVEEVQLLLLVVL